MIQTLIIIFSCSSVYLFSTKTRFKYGFIAGLLGQPFWIYETFTKEQWGMLIAALWFTASYIKGIKNNFNLPVFMQSLLSWIFFLLCPFLLGGCLPLVFLMLGVAEWIISLGFAIYCIAYLAILDGPLEQGRKLRI
ncbi:MAG: hypothetical protein AB1805_07475 [Nitrospirota bacterium]